MSKTTQFQAPTDTAKVHRREFLCLAPSAALASSIPLGITSPRPFTQSGQYQRGLGCTLGSLRRRVRVHHQAQYR